MGDKKKVLIVDDDKDLSMVLCDKFDIAGFESETASDGEEGLEKALRTHPDIILMDIIMPKMDGKEALAKLREDEWGKTAKVIMLTVLEDEKSVAHALEHETYNYLVKTDWDLDEVVDYVKKALE